MTATVTHLADCRRPPAVSEAPEVTEVTMLRYPDGRLRGFTKGVDLSCCQSRASVVEALRAVAQRIEDMGQ